MLTGHVDGVIRLWILEHGSVGGGDGGAGYKEGGEEEEDEEEDDDDDSEGPKLNNALTLVNEVYYPYPRDLRPPITALTMTADQKRFFSGDAAGLVCLFSSVVPNPR